MKLIFIRNIFKGTPNHSNAVFKKTDCEINIYEPDHCCIVVLFSNSEVVKFYSEDITPFSFTFTF